MPTYRSPFQTQMPPISTPVPTPMSMPPGANPPSMDQIPGEMDQNRVIEQIVAMLSSPDPQTQVMGKALVERFARTPGGAFMNRLTQGRFGTPQGTQGYSDELMTTEPGQKERGSVIGRYTPEEMAYGEKLGRAAMPGQIHGAEMAGTALNHILPFAPFAKLLPGGGRGPPSPLSPAGGSSLPTGPTGLPPGYLRQRAGELEAAPPPGPPPLPTGAEPPGLPEGLPRALGRDPYAPQADPKAMEKAYLRELDKGLPAAGKSKADVKKAIKPMPMTKLRKLLGLPD